MKKRLPQPFIIPALMLGLLLGGCATHEVNDNPLPWTTVPAQYSASTATTTVADGKPWYASLNDQNLSALIEKALEGNLDVKQAAARYKQAEALAKQSGAGRLPQVNAAANAGHNLDTGDGSAQVGAALTWEIDLFNRLGYGARADQYRQQAAAADVDAMRLLLSTELAETYYAVVTRQKQLTLLKQQIDADRELLRLNKLRLQEGIDTKVDVLQQRAQLAESQSLIPLVEAQLRVYENSLDILLGEVPDNKNRTTGDEVLAVPPTLPATGTPADLLLNRPDLKALRLNLVGADESIGAAIADRLPRISLTGSTMFTGGDGVSGPVTSVIGSLMQPLLDWGRRKAEVARNKAIYEEQLYGFTQAFIMGVGDVENALYREQKQRDYLKKIQKRQRILEETLEKSQAQYKQGLTDYLPVLSAVKDLRQVERSVIAEQEVLMDYRIQLHKALGGALPAASQP